jgi:hypothetical protein
VARDTEPAVYQVGRAAFAFDCRRPGEFGATSALSTPICKEPLMTAREGASQGVRYLDRHRSRLQQSRSAAVCGAGTSQCQAVAMSSQVPSTVASNPGRRPSQRSTGMPLR